MAAPRSESECGHEEGWVPVQGGGSASNRIGMPQPIVIMCAAGFGALLSGLVAFMQGSVALALFGVTLGRLGFFKNWVIATTYAERSLIVLIIVVLVTAAAGALAWTVGVLIWSMMANRTSRVRVALETMWSRLQHASRN
jgi:hypothetical protein